MKWYRMHIFFVDLGVVVCVDTEWVIWDFDTKIREKSWSWTWSWQQSLIYITDSSILAAVDKFLGEIASEFAYSYPFLRSVVCLSVVCHIHAPCLDHSTNVDAIWQVHLQGPTTHCVRWGSLTPNGKGRFGGLNPQPKMHLLTNDSPGGSIDQGFRLLSNEFDHLLLFLWRKTKLTNVGVNFGRN